MKRSGFAKRTTRNGTWGLATPKTALKKHIGLKRSTMRSKGHKSKNALWVEYGLQRPSKPRYQGLKGIYWYLLSQFIRQRDFYAYFGECIDQCGKKAKDWHDFDAGHFEPAQNCGFYLLFNRVNVNGQLKACNNPRFSPHSLIGYAIGLNKRYGAGTAEALHEAKLESKKTPTPEWSKLEYHREILKLQKDLQAFKPPYQFNP